jgi:hypothetical protein
MEKQKQKKADKERRRWWDLEERTEEKFFFSTASSSIPGKGGPAPPTKGREGVSCYRGRPPYYWRKVVGRAELNRDRADRGLIMVVRRACWLRLRPCDYHARSN